VTARLAARIFDLLPENGGTLSKDDILALAARSGAPPSIVPALLWVMHRYDLVRF
jgi:hypothetical protein